MILLKKYKKNIYVARGNTTIYKSHFKGLGFRWSKKIKGGPGFTIRLYNMKHLKSIYDKLKMITDGDVCLSLPIETKKRPLVQENREVIYPNKKVCVVDEIPLTEIETWKEAIHTVCTSFTFQIAFFSIYLNYLYPKLISPGLDYLYSEDFNEKFTNFNFWNTTS